MRLIDWEYGGLGDRFFDLGNLAVNVELSDDQERACWSTICGEARPNHLRRLRLMRLVSDMRKAGLGLCPGRHRQPARPPEKYLAYGNKHLERFLQAAGMIPAPGRIPRVDLPMTVPQIQPCELYAPSWWLRFLYEKVGRRLDHSRRCLAWALLQAGAFSSPWRGDK